MSESGSRVTVHSKLTVVSGIPVRRGKTYPFSVLDHLMGLHTLRVVFYYRLDRPDREKLEAALCDVLSYYPPVTGRLRRGDDQNWEVNCNDAGVRVLEAKVNVSVDEWLRSAHVSEEKDLTYWEDMPEDPCIWSPFYVQINEFEGGGLAIGLSCTHMHVDPHCATLFIKAWADAYRRASIANHPFFHPPGLRGRSTPNLNTRSAENYAAKSMAKPPPPVKMSTATFRFSDATVKKCLLEIQDQCPDATPFDVLTALFWTRVECAKNREHVGPHKLSICIDFRRLMHAPLPHGFYGNALHFSSVSSDRVELEEAGLGHMAELIHRHLSKMEEEEYWSAIDWVESQKDQGGKFAPPFRMYGPEITCANMEHVSAYGVVFEDTKPMHVAYHVGNVDGEGLIMVLPSPEDGLGRTVMVTLPDDQTAKLCNDFAILRLEPTMLFTGKQ